MSVPCVRVVSKMILYGLVKLVRVVSKDVGKFHAGRNLLSMKRLISPAT